MLRMIEVLSPAKCLRGVVAGAMLTVMAGTPALAGVVITGSSNRSDGGSSQTQVVMIQGYRERIESGPQTTLIDADRGTFAVLNAPTRTYTESKFKPAPSTTAASSPPSFHPTGATRTIAGYICRVFTASSTTAHGEQTVTGCFATEAPGWREYHEFNVMLARRIGTAGAHAGFPPGLPLSIVTSFKPHYQLSPKIEPARRVALEHKLNSQPPQVSEDVVSNVKDVKLPASEFTVPPGYTRLRLAGPLEQ